MDNKWTPESMLEIEILDPDDFLIVKETLERIGVASRTDKKLFQSCHILHKQGQYFIVHFKEMFYLDGKHSTLDETDIQRRNTIACLLHDWGLVTIKNNAPSPDDCAPLRTIKVVKHRERGDWELIPMYQIGKPKNK